MRKFAYYPQYGVPVYHKLEPLSSVLPGYVPVFYFPFLGFSLSFQKAKSLAVHKTASDFLILFAGQAAVAPGGEIDWR